MTDQHFETNNCDLCGSSDYKTLFTKTDTTSYWLAKCAEDDALDPNRAFQIVQCGRCDHVFVNPRLGRQIIGDIYARYWRKHAPEKLRYDPFAAHVSVQLAALGGNGKDKGKLLDFGCGWGSYLSVFTRDGWDAVGIEVDQAKIDFARKHGLNVVQGDLLDGLFGESSFDAVIAQQVFEHLYDPVPYLKAIHGLLKPNGVLFISVPNYGGIEARLKGVEWLQINPVAHVRYFTAKRLSRLLSDNGFRVLPKKHVRRFASTPKDLLYQTNVFVENAFGVHLNNLVLYGAKK